MCELTDTSSEDNSPVSTDKLSQAMANVDAATASSSEGNAAANAASAISTTKTDVPIYNSATTAFGKMLEVERNRALDCIYQIDAQLAALLAQRADHLAVYNATLPPAAPSEDKSK